MTHPVPHSIHHPHHPHEKHIPPHMMRARFSVTFPENSYQTLCRVFGDEDVASSAMNILLVDAPPEIQILALQTMAAISRLSDAESAQTESAHTTVSTDAGCAGENRARWTNPVLGASAGRLFSKLYGDNGTVYIDALENAPYEIAIVARLMAYLNEKGGEQNNGCH